ncbi:hypothetical protein MLD38_029210 [Melastoma candidum]|uniref:Uncharacterized protein n=1 Tax=Melastoma candidum TaxID=119954 RepID=A0ACB9N394_9MYRT|nr:hypothetical protein MLD38_029210 [Melastoma candidum]
MEARKDSRHFEAWVGNFRQLPQPESDHGDELEWEESEVVWSAMSISSPPCDSPDSPRTGSKARPSRSNLTAVLLGGHEYHMIRKKLAVDPAMVVHASLCGRNLSPDMVTGMSAPIDLPAWHSWKARGREAEEEALQGKTAVPMPVQPHMIGAGSHTSRTMACSVFEGAGRTLKGRDLRRVRDGVLRKTGFLD